MARSARDIQTDIDRIVVMINTARDTGNKDTADMLAQTEARFESELEELTKDSRETRLASIAAADKELWAFEYEPKVSRELRAAIALSRSDLVNRRKNA